MLHCVLFECDTRTKNGQFLVINMSITDRESGFIFSEDEL